MAFGYNSTAHPRLAIRAADLSATSWGSWYKVYTSDDKPTPADIGAAATSHTHSYLPLSGGTVTGQIQKAASGTSWVTGRSVAAFRVSGTVGANSYVPGVSIKSQNGSWEIGTYTNNDLYFSYITDTNFNAGTNTTTSQVRIAASGSSFVGSLSGNASTASAVKDSGNSTNTTFAYSKAGLETASWLAAWNGYELRAISPANLRTTIGAAASSHTHSYLPLSGGTITGQLKSTYANTASILVSHGTTNIDAGVSCERSDTGVGVSLLVGSSGTNHGIWSRKHSKWIIYCDSAGTVRLDSGAVAKATMHVYSNNITLSASTPTTTQYSSGYNMDDSQGVNIGYIRPIRTNDNCIALQLETVRTVSGTKRYCSIQTGITSSGGAYYYVTSPAAFRSAIGITSGTGNPPASGSAGNIYIKYA